VTPAPVADTNGIVYAAIGPTVFAFNPTTVNTANPQPAWSFTLANSGVPADAISLAVGTDVLYVAARDFFLYALTKQ